MSNISQIILERHGNVALVTIASEATRNALDCKLAAQLREACETINKDESYGAMVIRGAGGNFCSGANRELLSDVAENPAADASYKDLGAVYDAFVIIGAMLVPTV